MNEPFELTVRGKPEPRGSKSSRVIYTDPKNKVPKRYDDGSIMSVVFDTNEGPSSKWMRHIEIAARARWRGDLLEDVALDVVLAFFLERKDSHYGTGRNRRLVKNSSRARPHVRPDDDKLARPVLDALTGVVWKDDGQVCGLSVDKWYAVPLSASDDGQGVVIQVALTAQQRAVDLPLEQRMRWIEPNDADASFPQDTLLADACG